MEDHEFRNDDVGLPIPPLDPHFPLFSDNDEITPTVDVDSLFNVDFDFSFDDLSFADNLLLEQPDPNSDPDSDPLILSSDISQDWANPNSDRNRTSDGVVRVYDCSPISSEESNFRGKCDSPEIGSSKNNSGVYSGNSRDRAVSASLLDDNCGDNGDNSDSSRKMIKIEHVKGSDEFRKDCDSSDSVVECVSKSKRKIGAEARISEPISKDSGSCGSGSECVSQWKRKMKVGQDYEAETRVSKFRRSNACVIANDEDAEGEGEGEGDEKRKARLIRNRESAQLSRQRKKRYVEELEDKVRAMHSTITDLNSRISYFMTENATLRQQLSNGVAGPGVPPQPGMYPMHPMAPMPYPWMGMPYPPGYMVKPQGSQVPLVPIPRLKPQNPVSAPKVKKSSEGKKEKDKGEKRTKKVASVSLLGLLFFMLLFGGLVPMVNVRYGRSGEGFGGTQKGAVFIVDKHVEKERNGNSGIGHGRVLQQSNNSNVGNGNRNASEPLTVSLYVPRNDKLVKLDGNLIIHSVLASEKAKASQTGEAVKSREETGLAIHGSYPPYPTPGPGSNNWRHPYLDRNQNGRQRALGSADFTPVGSDGKLQQWFREGLAGPMLSSGMCTEVFQFDVSPTPGSVVPASSVANKTSEDRQNTTPPNIPKNRRILHGHAIPFSDHTLNTTEEHMQSHEQSDGLKSNKSRSSVVVSVLVDPREVGNGDGEGVIGSKTLPRIFVVVLIDSVKWKRLLLIITLTKKRWPTYSLISPRSEKVKISTFATQNLVLLGSGRMNILWTLGLSLHVGYCQLAECSFHCTSFRASVDTLYRELSRIPPICIEPIQQRSVNHDPSKISKIGGLTEQP